ncbi:MAG: HDOD domain-containing protein, partial [bacterium]
EAIQHHHSPAAAVDEFRALVYAVHLGDLVAMMGGTGTGADTLAYKIDPGYEEYFSVDKDAIPELMFIVQDEFTRTKSAVFLDEGV